MMALKLTCCAEDNKEDVLGWCSTWPKMVEKKERDGEWARWNHPALGGLSRKDAYIRDTVPG